MLVTAFTGFVNTAERIPARGDASRATGRLSPKPKLRMIVA